MKLQDVGEVLATRTLELDGGAPVQVTMGVPQRFPDGNDDWYCPYRITGLGDAHVRYAAGVDGFQALLLTMQIIGTYLSTSEEAKDGGLKWLGELDLGFPVVPSAKP